MKQGAANQPISLRALGGVHLTSAMAILSRREQHRLLLESKHQRNVLGNLAMNAEVWKKLGVHPLDLTIREVAAVFSTCLQLPPVLRNQSLNALQESWEASIAQLLLGWEQAEDEEGQKYFQNESKGESMWEHPSQEQIGAVPSKGGSKEVYQALKTSKLKLAEHISMLSPSSKTKLATSPDIAEESEIVVEQIESLDSPDTAPPAAATVGSPPTTGASTNTTMASTGELKKPPSRGHERNGVQARSVLRIAGDILQARSTAPLESRRPSLRKNRMQQRLVRSASESQLKFNWSAQPIDAELKNL
eukprot:s2880_g5.t1